jgi:hypothetical protein
VSTSQPGHPPDRIEYTGGPPAQRVPHPSDFYRSPTRVAILGTLASVPYFFWWMWQLFLFTRREGFPRARRFWWILVPIYGWVVIYRQFDDLDKADRALGQPGLPPNGPIALLVGSSLAGYITNRLPEPAATIGFLLASGLSAMALLLGQRLANGYIKARYPISVAPEMTWGEITATVLGLIFLALILLAALLPS